MAVSDSTGGFNYYENNTGEQVSSAQQAVAGQVGERQNPAGHMQGVGEVLAGHWNAGMDWLGDQASSALDWGAGLVQDGIDFWHDGMDQISESLGGQVVGGTEGVFVGIDTGNVDSFKGALDTYINTAADIVGGLNIDASLEASIRGTAIEESFHEFLLAIKTLLINYVKSLNNLKTEIDTAVDNYVSADTSIGGNVSSDAGEITSNANNIKID